MLAVGDIAPATDIAVGHERYSLTPHSGKKMVIFFFPRADTSGCSKEAIQFYNLFEDFAADVTEVIGISKDTVKNKPNFAQNMTLNVILELIIILMCANNLAYGSKNRCMAGPIWAFSGQPLSLTPVAKSLPFGQK